jgi:murein DD-endopeptidase MepM/ murein hydrolase activator NlpD
MTGTVHAAVGLPDTPDDDGVAVIEVGAPGFQSGIYSGSDAELTAFIRGGKTFTWVRGESQRSSAYAQWTPRITKSGEYLIEAFIPGENATARRVRYHITGVVGADATTPVEVNQLNVSDDWARLGFFQLDGGHQFSGMVSLSNLVGAEATPDVKVAFGPIRWTRVERRGIQPGFADGFDSPVGTAAERRQPNDQWGPTTAHWNGEWVDANPFLNYYTLGYHTGVDLNLPRDMDKGAPCYSIADGVVTYAGPVFNNDGRPSGFGNLVIVKHDPYVTAEGEQIIAYSRYAHIKDWVVRVNQRVRRGDQLATIWNVGTKAYHLHFDISLSGVLQSRPNHWPGERRDEVIEHYVDPYTFIRANRPRE